MQIPMDFRYLSGQAISSDGARSSAAGGESAHQGPADLGDLHLSAVMQGRRGLSLRTHRNHWSSHEMPLGCEGAAEKQ